MLVEARQERSRLAQRGRTCSVKPHRSMLSIHFEYDEHFCPSRQLRKEGTFSSAIDRTSFSPASRILLKRSKGPSPCRRRFSGRKELGIITCDSMRRLAGDSFRGIDFRQSYTGSSISSVSHGERDGLRGLCSVQTGVTTSSFAFGGSGRSIRCSWLITSQ